MRLGIIAPISIACVFFRSYVPFSWHANIIYQVVCGFIKGKLKKPTDVCTIKSRAWFDLMDHNMHMSNSCYNQMMDGGRYNMVARLFGFSSLIGSGRILSLGSTTVSFLQQVTPLTLLNISTKIVDYDDKWIILQQVISSGAPDQENADDANAYGTVHAIALAKIVVKEGKGSKRGLNVKPEYLLRDLGYDTTYFLTRGDTSDSIGPARALQTLAEVLNLSQPTLTSVSPVQKDE
eukprot:CFRG0680T1